MKLFIYIHIFVRSSHRCFKCHGVGLGMFFRAGFWTRWLRHFRIALIILAKVFLSWQSHLPTHFLAPCENRDCSNIICRWIRKMSLLYSYFCNKQLWKRLRFMWRNLEGKQISLCFVDLTNISIHLLITKKKTNYFRHRLYVFKCNDLIMILEWPPDL